MELVAVTLVQLHGFVFHSLHLAKGKFSYCFGWSTSIKQFFQRAIAEMLLLRFANTAKSSTGARLL
jgi:hypothetical protein